MVASDEGSARSGQRKNAVLGRRGGEYCTLKYPTIILGWSDLMTLRGIPKKSRPPPKKNFVFWGGVGNQVFLLLNPLCLCHLINGTFLFLRSNYSDWEKNFVTKRKKKMRNNFQDTVPKHLLQSSMRLDVQNFYSEGSKTDTPFRKDGVFFSSQWMFELDLQCKK